MSKMEKINAEVFLKVVETGSFQAAAKELDYTQAGVSDIVKTMEETTGITLFIRAREGVRLTAEGRELLYYIQQIRNSERLFAAKVAELRNIQTGSVSVRIFNSISVCWIPDILATFSEKYPNVEVRLISSENDLEAERMVYDQDIDCGFFVMPLRTELDTVFLSENKLVASVSPQHPLASGERFPISEIRSYPYIKMLYQDDYYLSELFRMAGGTPGYDYAIDNDIAALAMAERGLGYCIFPEMVTRGAPFDLKHMELDPPLSIQVHIGTRSIEKCSGAAKAFIKHVTEWADKNLKTM